MSFARTASKGRGALWGLAAASLAAFLLMGCRSGSQPLLHITTVPPNNEVFLIEEDQNTRMNLSSPVEQPGPFRQFSEGNDSIVRVRVKPGTYIIYAFDRTNLRDGRVRIVAEPSTKAIKVQVPID